MMLSEFGSTKKELEKEELCAPDGVAAPEVYPKLMICYLLENDLCSAKFLWKRAPAAAKEADGVLAALWSVGQKLWTKDFPATYAILHRDWPEYLQKAISELEGVIRERVLSLISRAYTSITLPELAAFAGLPADQAAAVARRRRWSVDGAVVGPKPAPPAVQATADCEKSLAVLTQYVSFLEN